MKKTTNFEASNPEDAINKAYLDEKCIKKEAHLSLLEKNYNECILQDNKQSGEEISIQRAVKTIFRILYDKNLFDSFPNADKVSNDFLFLTRRRLDLKEINDDFIQ